MGNAVPRLGVDVEVGGFEAFNRNLERVNQLMAEFAKTAPSFSGAAGLLNLALKAFDDNGGNAAAALIEFGEALKNVSTRKLNSLPKSLDAAAKAFQSFQKGASGAVATAQSISVPTVTQPRTGAAGRATGPVLEPGGKQADLVAKIRQRQQDRAIADEERFQDRMRQIRERSAAIDAKIANKEGRQAAVTGAAAAQAAATFNRLSVETERSVERLQDKLQGKLADALLNKKDEAAVRARLESFAKNAQAELKGIQTAAGGRMVNPQDIEALRSLQAELKRAGVAQAQFIEQQRKATTGGPSVAFLARARLRDATAGLDALEFATGKIAQATRSANPVVRTFARTIFAVEDAAAAAKLSGEAFGIVIGKMTRTLQAISLPFRILSGAFSFFGRDISKATGPLNLFLQLAGFKGAREIAAMTSEVDKLGASFKRLNLDKSIQDLQGLSGEKAARAIPRFGKKDQGDRTLESAVPTLDFAALAEQNRRAVAAVQAKADADRGRSAQRQAALAQQVQGQVEQIERAGVARIQVLEAQKAKARELAEQAATQATTRGGQQRLNEVLRIEQQIAAAITRTQGQTAAAIAAQNQKLATTSKTAAQSLNKELLNTKSAADQAGQSLSKLGRIGETAIGVGIGQVAVGALRSLTSGIRGLLGQGLTALGAFESQILGIQTLTRREILDSDETLSFAAAEEIAAVRGKELFDVMQQLAITSPFNTQDVVDIFNLGLSYDFTTKEAEKLTRILVDFTAGTGRGADAAERIVLALGQVRSAGKLTGAELKQLRENGVPVLRALADATGKTAKEINEFIQKGGVVDAELAISAIANTLGTEFAGAAQKSQSTVRGLISSIQDLRDVTLRNIIQPAADALVKPIASTLAGALNTDEFQSQVQALGESISGGIQRAMDALSEVAGAIVGIFQLIPAPVREAAVSFLGFASAGIALSTALTALLPVLRFIAPLILSILSPINLAIGAVALLATAWRQNWFSIQQVTQQAFTTIQGALADIPAGVQRLAASFNQGLSQIPQSVQTVASSIIETFSHLLSQMVEFGANIVTSFAEGIIATVGVVIDAINVIGQAITSLLAPGSPPKLLPFLDKWGQEAADVYLQGWTQADFGVFDDLAGNIQKAISTIDPDIDEGEIRKIQAAVFGAVNAFKTTGDTSGSALAGLGDIPATLLPSIQRITQATLEAAKAAQVYESIQKELADTTKRFDDALKPVETRLRSLADAESELDTGNELKSLQGVINNRFATEEQKRRAMIKIQRLQAEGEKRSLESQRDTAVDAIETRLSAAEMEKERTEEQLAILQKRFDLETQFSAKAVTAAGAAGDAADSAAKKAKKLKEELGSLSAPGLESLAGLKLPEIDIENKIAPAIESFQKRFEEGKERILGTFTDLRTKITLQITLIRNAFNLGLAGIKDPSQTGLGAFVNNAGLVVASLGKIVEDARAKFAQLRSIFNQGFSGGTEIGGKGQEQLVDVGTPASTIEQLALKAGQAAKSLQTAYGAIVASTQTFVTNFTAAFNAEEGGLVQKIFAGLEATEEQATKLRDDVVAKINKAFGSDQAVTLDLTAIQTGITTALGSLFQDVSGKVQEAAGDTSAAAGQFAELAANIYNGISTALGTGTIDAAALKTNVTTAVQNLFTSAGETGAGIVATVKTQLDLLFGEVTFADLSTSFTNLTTQVGEAITGLTWTDSITPGVFGSLKDAVTGAVTSLFSGIQNLLSGDFGGAAGDFSGAISGSAEVMGMAIGPVAGEASGVLDDLNASGIAAQISGAISASITTFVLGAIGALPDLITTTLNTLKPLLESTSKIVGGIVAGLVGGFLLSIVSTVNKLSTPEGFAAISSSIDTAVEAIGTTITGILTAFVQGIVDQVSPGTDIRPTLDIFEGFDPEEFGRRGGEASARITKELTGFDTRIISQAIEKWIGDNVAEIKASTARIGGFVIQAIKDFETNRAKFAADLETFAEGFAVVFAFLSKLDADVSLFFAQTRTATASALETIGNSLLGFISSLFEGVNSIVAGLQDFARNIPGVGEGIAGGIEGIKLPEIDPLDLTASLEIDEAAAAKVAANAKTNLDVAFAKLKVDAPSFDDTTVKTKAEAAATAFAFDFDNALATKFAANTTAQQQLGTDIAEGITTGAETQTALPNEIIENLMSNLATQARVKSPSLEADERVGQPVGEGIIQGVSTALSNADMAVTIDPLFAGMQSAAGIEGDVSALAKDTVGAPIGQGILTGIREAFANPGDILAPLRTALSGTALKTAAQSSATAIAGVYTKLTTDLKTMFTDVKDSILASFDEMTEGATFRSEDMAKNITKVYTEFIESNLDRFDKFFKDLFKLFERTYKDLVDITEDLADDLSGIFQDLINEIIREFRRLRTEVTAAVRGLATAVETAFEDIKTSLTNLSKQAVDAAIAQFNRLGPAISAALSAVITNLTSGATVQAFRSAGEAIADALVDGIIEGLSGVGQQAQLAAAIVDLINGAVRIATRLISDPIGDPTPVGASGRPNGFTPIPTDRPGVPSSMDRLTDALVALNDTLLIFVSNRPASLIGATVASVAGPVGLVTQSGSIENHYTIEIGSVTERQANRLASSFSTFERLNR